MEHRWNPYDNDEDYDDDDGAMHPLRIVRVNETYSCLSYSYLTPGSGVRGKRLVIVKRAARIPVISYFLSS